MRYLNIREMRSLLGKLDELVKEQQELIITRNKKEIARILPVQSKKKRPTHAQLRQLTRRSEVLYAKLIRLDRDEP
jgi:antitoxin (DNA-binding transcriptional repressor) of toxin-antitoxin stability system